ncbi:MAG: nucleotide sugar dehydrogenase [Alphaproteobacteria bacterium]|nr:nucleotide sugar dehydrogenase [Alphaproteobacteria bacterium]
MKQEKIAVIGLGYVGLPLALALAKKFDGVVGFDIDQSRIEALGRGHDWSGEVAEDQLTSSRCTFTHDVHQLKDRTFYIVTVPTPIDEAKRPELSPILGASAMVGEAMRESTHAVPPVVVYESTVWPGLTEEICGPALAAASGLRQGVDFKLGYSPERINPGDQKHQLTTITKIISAQDEATLQRLKTVYGGIITAGLHLASTIKVAEAAKVMENTQRDINIALMNELALICDRLNMRTADVLAAAGTKWNFLPFTPGLVGGHCIGVDPYYLTMRAESLGYIPQVILSGRRINDGMPHFIAQKMMKLLVSGGAAMPAKIGILGLSFKENVRDIRNSRVPEIAAELKQFGAEVLIHDPHADPVQARHEYGLTLAPAEALKNLSALVFAVPHKEFLDTKTTWLQTLAPQGLVADIKSIFTPADLPAHLTYWSL